MAIISNGVIIKNDPPELIPKMENTTVYPITKIMRITAKTIITIPVTFDFCINKKLFSNYLEFYHKTKQIQCKKTKL